MPLENTYQDNKERALELMKAQRWEMALENWEVWFKKTEDSHKEPNSLHDRAICKFHLSDKDAALTDLDAALELQPEYGYRYSSRAWMKQANGDTDGAIADYKTALTLDPEDAIVLNNLGLLEESKGYKTQSNKRFKIADSLQKTKNPVEKVKEAVVREAVVKAPEVKAKAEKTILSEMKSVFVSKESRKVWLKFILNGFNLKD